MRYVVRKKKERKRDRASRGESRRIYRNPRKIPTFPLGEGVFSRNENPGVALASSVVFYALLFFLPSIFIIHEFTLAPRRACAKAGRTGT